MRSLCLTFLLFAFSANAEPTISLFNCMDPGSNNDDGSVITVPSETAGLISDDGRDIRVEFESEDQSLSIPAGVLKTDLRENLNVPDQANGEFFTMHLDNDDTLIMSPRNDISPWIEVLDSHSNLVVMSYNCSFNPVVLDILRRR